MVSFFVFIFKVLSGKFFNMNPSIKLVKEFLQHFDFESYHHGASTGCRWIETGGSGLESYSPVDGNLVGKVKMADQDSYEKVIQTARKAFIEWSAMPAPKRGEIVRQVGNKLREYKDRLGLLVSYEMGKSLQEGWGEVQEMIDICDFAVGLSRQLYGLTMPSERAGHRMYEQYQPLGVVGIITAFNFPVAVWAWNSIIAWVCGNTCVWKPSEKTPVTSLVCHKIIAEVLKENNVPEGVNCLLIGNYRVGEWMSADSRFNLISATGSIPMGKKVGQAVAARLGKSLLELGGNNAIIVSEHANLDLALRAAIFGAAGTAGQRCTTTRRLIVQDKVYDNFRERLSKAYRQLKVGSPLEENNHVGPLIDKKAVETYQNAINQIKAQGGKAVIEGGRLEGQQYASGCYVKPAVYEIDPEATIVQQETFAPILYLMRYHNLEEAIRIHNNVPQGLSSSIITGSLQESEKFLSASGSDCGIANVNIGTSGAEIGGAFGGEKETGGGRESGTDAWKNYMRRQTVTINYSDNLPLAQGIKFTV
jgi:aldehyde dehydrogenase (NAD+)